jgi:hypothetical protein
VLCGGLVRHIFEEIPIHRGTIINLPPSHSARHKDWRVNNEQPATSTEQQATPHIVQIFGHVQISGLSGFPYQPIFPRFSPNFWTGKAFLTNFSFPPKSPKTPQLIEITQEIRLIKYWHFFCFAIAREEMRDEPVYSTGKK